MPTIKIETERFQTKVQQKLLKMLDDKAVRKEINTRVKDAINQFVPMKSGALRKSAIVTHKSISWGRRLKYARYQYGGEVYGPNLPGLENGAPAWRSRKGATKHPTGRELGVPGVAILHPIWKLENGIYSRPNSDETAMYRFGYTTPGTHHHWDEYFKYGIKMKTNLEITRYLKKECKRRGLKT